MSDTGNRRRHTNESGRRNGDRPHGNARRNDQRGRKQSGYGRSNQRRRDRDHGDRKDGRQRDHKGHNAQRGGRNRDHRGHSGGERQNFRTDMKRARSHEPRIPEDIEFRDLDESVRQDLRSLSKETADRVGRHMVAAVQFMADDPRRALSHARAAKNRGGRIAVVRETAGIAAYHAGEWKEALSELRAARRMGAGDALLPVMADCERGLGRPEKAIEIAKDEASTSMSKAERAELAIVVAGARRDMGDVDAAVLELERFGLDEFKPDLSCARLYYAYADGLIAAGRCDEAKEWFDKAAEKDPEGFVDAAERAEELE